MIYVLYAVLVRLFLSITSFRGFRVAVIRNYSLVDRIFVYWNTIYIFFRF